MHINNLERGIVEHLDSKLKVKLRELPLRFIKNNCQRRYKYLVRDMSYFVKHHSDSTKKFSEIDIFNMLEFLIDHIFAMFGGRVFQQTVGIPFSERTSSIYREREIKGSG
jgi:hypothetical protein